MLGIMLGDSLKSITLIIIVISTYLLCNFLPLQLQHLLLFIGVINYSLSSNQQFAFHSLRTKTYD